MRVWIAAVDEISNNKKRDFDAIREAYSEAYDTNDPFCDRDLSRRHSRDRDEAAKADDPDQRLLNPKLDQDGKVIDHEARHWLLNDPQTDEREKSRLLRVLKTPGGSMTRTK